MPRKPKPPAPTRPCPGCTRAIPVTAKICPECGKAIINVRLKMVIQGETRIVEKPMACDPEDAFELENSEPIEIENPDELPEREN